ncbi:hypothetical protein BKA93DRAFT_748711 [Sparassis latifolia]
MPKKHPASDAPADDRATKWIDRGTNPNSTLSPNVDELPSARPSERAITSLCNWKYTRPLSQQIRKMSAYNSKSTGHFGITYVPDNAIWGPFGSDDDLHRFLCINGKPITIWLGRPEYTPAFRRLKSSMPTGPVGDRCKTQVIVLKPTRTRYDQSVNINPIWASKYMDKTLKTGEKQAVPFKESFNVMDRLGPKNEMQHWPIQEMGVNDLVLLQCNLCCWRVNKDSKTLHRTMETLANSV